MVSVENVKTIVKKIINWKAPGRDCSGVLD